MLQETKTPPTGARCSTSFVKEAGELGANAVEVRTMEDAGTGERVVAALFGTEADRDSDALALFCPDGTR